ncbi:MAG: hypothetical protein JXA42_10395 [Anaerolineales bacterium]|nr:hypothetical protein [Anaerolineales bacterium]
MSKRLQFPPFRSPFERHLDQVLYSLLEREKQELISLWNNRRPVKLGRRRKFDFLPRHILGLQCFVQAHTCVHPDIRNSSADNQPVANHPETYLIAAPVRFFNGMLITASFSFDMDEKKATYVFSTDQNDRRDKCNPNG